MRWLPLLLLLATPVLAAPPPATPTSFSPQDEDGTVYGPAPVPNRDMLAPMAPARAATTKVAPTLFSSPRQDLGMAYPPNSTVQDQEAERMRPTPGVNLQVPLQ